MKKAHKIGTFFVIIPIILALLLVLNVDIIVYPPWRLSNTFEDTGAIIARAMMVTFIFSICEAIGFYFLKKSDKEKDNKPK